MNNKCRVWYIPWHILQTISSQVINFAEEPFVCTDELFAWNIFAQHTLRKIISKKIVQYVRVGITVLRGSTAATPVEHWVAVSACGWGNRKFDCLRTKVPTLRKLILFFDDCATAVPCICFLASATISELLRRRAPCFLVNRLYELAESITCYILQAIVLQCNCAREYRKYFHHEPFLCLQYILYRRKMMLKATT